MLFDNKDITECVSLLFGWHRLMSTIKHFVKSTLLQRC